MCRICVGIRNYRSILQSMVVIKLRGQHKMHITKLRGRDDGIES